MFLKRPDLFFSLCFCCLLINFSANSETFETGFNSSFPSQTQRLEKRGLEQGQETLKVLLERAKEYQTLGEPRKALLYYQRALEVNSAEADPILIYFNLGTCYLQLKDYDKARESYQQVLKFDPQNASAFFQLGLIFTQNRDYQKSIESYSKALEFRPEDYRIYYMRSVARSKIYDFEGVIEDCSRTLELKPSYGEAFYYRAIAHYFLQNYQRALSDLEIARDLFQEKGKINQEQKAQEFLDNIEEIVISTQENTQENIKE